MSNQINAFALDYAAENAHALPDDASPAKVSAEFKDGVLTVHLVKTAKARPQHIEVKVA